MIHLLLLIAQAAIAFANTEKAIFIAPSNARVPTSHPTLEDLYLHTISPRNHTLRTHIKASFPVASSPDGAVSWILLDDLKQGQRYESRLCWAATQPTSFLLTVYELPIVFGSIDLVTSLAEYSATRQPSIDSEKPQENSSPKDKKDKYKSVLFLQIIATADYYTANQQVMENVPPVLVDIILDPYLGNVFPQSLIPTAAYITLLACGGILLSEFVRKFVGDLPARISTTARKKNL